MHEQWYSDKRDLVKWAALVHVTKCCSVKKILQVPFTPPHTPPWAECRLLKSESEEVPFPQSESEEVPFPREVWEHFRRLKAIKCLGETIGIEIEVFESSWTNNTRNQYIQELCDSLEQFKSTSLVLFLDPDNGIEPQKANLRHVKKSEIKTIFKKLKVKDCLVFYQHARRKANWIEETRNSFASAIDLSHQTVQTLRCAGDSSAFAKDVAFHFVQKP